ncbi:MAG: TetR/AcrR family transcriptional regulator [Verrucomicrobiales bacterium]
MNLPHDTKTKILDVAEKLFADLGTEAVSIRDITDAADVNLAAVNYHFGSKEDLIFAVLERRITPLNDARIEAIEAVERAAKGKPAKVEEILEAFIRPTLTCCGDVKGASAFSKLFGRCLFEPKPEVERFLKKQFEPLVERLDAALMKALPHLSRADIFWRMKFTFGALHHWLLTKEKYIPAWAEGTPENDQVQKLIAFAAAGFYSK